MQGPQLTEVGFSAVCLSRDVDAPLCGGKAAFPKNGSPGTAGTAQFR